MGDDQRLCGPVGEIRSAVLADTQARIAAHGWTVIAVFPTQADPGPLFAYTVGLSGKGLPESAARALVAYAEHLGGASLTEEIEVAATDLLGDLRHLFDALGADLEVAVEVSRVHYRAEIRGTL